MTTDKLSFLRTVGSGFGPLIYKLNKTASYQQLQEHCKTIWETLKHAPDLPEIMVMFVLRAVLVRITSFLLEIL